MDTSKINKDAKTLVNIMTKSEDVFLLTQEVNRILVHRRKELRVSIATPTLNQGVKIAETKFEKPVNILDGDEVIIHTVIKRANNDLAKSAIKAINSHD